MQHNRGVGIVCLIALTLVGCASAKTETETVTETQLANKENSQEVMGAQLYDSLTEEQKEFLTEEQQMSVEQINGMSYEAVNAELLGTGFELYNQSSGVERYGLTYSIDSVEEIPSKGYYISFPCDSNEEITYEQLLQIRLKEKDMRIEDFMKYKYEITPRKDDKNGYDMMLPLAGYPDTYVILSFREKDDGTVKMKTPYMEYFYSDEKEEGWVFSILYGQDWFKAFYENEDYSLDGKVVCGIQYTSVTDHSLVIRVSNWTDQPLKVNPSFQLYKADKGEEILLSDYTCETDEEQEQKLCSFSIYPVDLTGENPPLEPGSYRIKYGKNTAGYVYCELDFEVE